MASSVVEDEDLIDLEDGGGALGCVSRVTSLPEASAEELEHLLDVCPPQLEQKLSLTRRQESTRENLESDDCLVTLGHDQLVPRRKRIDVVSSETIKRIRDITRNLEPVIRDCENSRLNENEPTSRQNGDYVDGNVGINSESRDPSTTRRRRDVTYETQAINSAFDFLSELDDDDDNNDEEDDQPPDKKRRRNSNYKMAERDSEPPSCYPLEPTCLIEDKSTSYRDIDRANRAIEASDKTFVIQPDDDPNRILENHENPGFEISPMSKKTRTFETGKTGNFSNGQTRFARLWNDGTTMRDEGGRRVEERTERKSWSEGENRGIVWRDGENLKNFERSTSVEIDRLSEPSTSNGITTMLRSPSRNILRPAPDHSASSSECSDVDWSWVEEYDVPGTLSSQHRSSFASRDAANKIQKSQSNRGIVVSKCPNIDIQCSRLRPFSAPSSSSSRVVPPLSYATTSFNRENDDDDDFAAISATGGSDGRGRGGSSGGGGGGGGKDTKQRERGAGCRVTRDSRASSVAMSVVGTGDNKSSVSEPRLSVTSRDFQNTEEDIITRDDYNREICSVNEYDATSTSNFNLQTSSDSTRIVIDDSRRISGSFGFNGDNEVATVRNSRRNNRSDNNDSNSRPGGTTTANSWLRASMRRIRHLRMPDAERNSDRRIASDSMLTSTNLILSGPNSLPDIALIAPEILAAHTNGGISARPSSAPVANRDNPTSNNSGTNNNNNNNNNNGTPRRGRRHASRTRAGTPRSQESRPSRTASARNGNNNAISDSNEIGLQTSASATSPQGRRVNGNADRHSGSTSTSVNPARRICERQRDVDRDNERGDDEDEDENPLGRWPHPLSPALACLGCTLGLFNISRFAILSIQFGANFIVQFLVLSLILGIPLLTLQVCLGQRLAAGAVDMWRISPVFHGVGIALLVAQAFIGIYSIIGVSWMFVYFRDSFITKQDRYRWAEPFLLYREDTRILHNMTTYKLHETVPDYFSGVVLQRHHLNEPDPGIVTLKFQVAFNLAVVWMIVFVSLSKGLRSYGKVVYVFTLVPVFGTLILCTKLLGLTPPGSIHQLFPATVWSEFFINSKSWVAASSEVFLTWGLLGAAAMQVAAHNKHKHLLQRDTSLVVVLTLVVLLLSAFLANTCVQILRHYGYSYTTSSFERISGYTFMRHVNQPSPSGYSNTPERFMSHASFLLGQRVVRPGADLGTESGYQVLRLSTELVPATLAILGTEQVSPFWAVLFYFILILFGIAQQLAIWHCVITGIMAINTKTMKLWETTITFFSCACAYILGLPMATELGIYVVYYLDYTVGGAWWIMILYLVQVGAVFAVRGRPHTGETVVAELFPPTGRCLRHWAGPLLSFTWNVILPVALMVLSITIFKSSSFRDLYVYRRTSRDYWSVWARQLGAAIQLTPILIIPGVAIIQTCRYLNSGPPDIFDRIQLLYRPPLDNDESTSSPINYGNETSTSIHGNGILPSTNDPPFEDPPPKYTPPPSYTTATGARIAKMLRQSFRRSVRRIASVLGETSTPRARPALQPPPPDYATVLVEMNQSGTLPEDATIREARPDLTDTSNSRETYRERNRPSTIDRMTRISTIERSSVERTHSTMDRGRGRIYNNIGSSNLTAADVANLLRSSIRRGGGGARTHHTSLCGSSINDSLPLTTSLSTTTTTTTTAASVENLVDAAVPINEDSLVYDKDLPLVHDESENDDDDDEEEEEDEEKKTVNEMDNSVSVI